MYRFTRTATLKKQVNEKLIEDREYAALLDKFKDNWAEGSIHDTLVRLA